MEPKILILAKNNFKAGKYGNTIYYHLDSKDINLDSFGNGLGIIYTCLGTAKQFFMSKLTTNSDGKFPCYPGELGKAGL